MKFLLLKKETKITPFMFQNRKVRKEVRETKSSCMKSFCQWESKVRMRFGGFFGLKNSSRPKTLTECTLLNVKKQNMGCQFL